MKRSIALILFVLGAGFAAAGGGPVQVDRKYDDWQDVPSLAVFARIFEPASFTRERRGEWEVQPLSVARFWKTGGTQLNEIKALASGPYLYFFISSQSAFSEALSVFLYLHSGEAGAGEENRATLEIAPRENGLPGPALLWVRGDEAESDEAEKVRLLPVGRLVSENFFLEGRIDLPAFRQALGEEPGPQAYVDVTTCYFDPAAGEYEEYFFTSIYLKDIPRLP